jgi:hypothetical protein
MPAYKINEVTYDHRLPILDWVDMSAGAMGVTGAAHTPSSADLRADLLGRPLTEVERAADDAQDMYRERDAARHAVWVGQLSAKERKRMGIV